MSNQQPPTQQPPTHPTGFVESVKTGYRKFFGFRGRASRIEYWWFALYCTLVFTALMSLSKVLELVFSGGVMSFTNFWSAVLLYVLVPVPLAFASVRRFHDIGLSGFWFLGLATVNLFFMLPNAYHQVFPLDMDAPPSALRMALALVANIVLLTVLLWKGNEGDNKYGPSTR